MHDGGQAVTPQQKRQAGYQWEHDIVDLLREMGYPHAERRRAGAASDRGDVAGIPGVVIECKNHKLITLGVWMKGLIAKQRNDNGSLGVLFIKRKQASTRQSYAVMTVEQAVVLLRAAADGLAGRHPTE